jgi:polyvinyl alcohol dehydrogenase (cytochrome)
MQTKIIACLMLLCWYPGLSVTAQTGDGATLFNMSCASCHMAPASPEIPNLDALARYEPTAILMALTDGAMRLQAEKLTAAERIAVTEFLTARQVPALTTRFSTGMCTATTPMAAPESGPLWNGWGADAGNRRYQTATGLRLRDMSRLKLRWAFGIPDVTQSRSQPAVAGGRLFMGSQSGAVYALDADTGCTHWIFKAGAGVRTAITVGPIMTAGANGYAIYFADARATAYAVTADSGRLIWSRKLDTHPAARATGAPVLHAGRLYVPLSGVSEESTAVDPKYGCCTFRGSISAVDARTGTVIWKTYMVDEPKPRGKSSTGVQLYGPAGVAVWSAPTIDAKRGLLYTTTGNAYADPQPPTSDAVVALSLADGEFQWINQILPDVWIMGCDLQSSGGNPRAGDNPNCPENVGPDFDFSASPVLTRLPGGRDVLIATQKSGIGYALDPENKGRRLWSYRWGQGSPIGAVWGAAADDRAAYFAVADIVAPAPGGLHAVSLRTGKRLWYTPPAKPLCGSGQGCSAVQAAAVTVIDGVVFSGSHDGAMRAYNARNGRIIWTYDTNREYTTVNGVPARGGSIDGPGPVVAGRMLYITSGNGGMFGLPGNVLLAFEPE